MTVRLTAFDDPAGWTYVHDNAPDGGHGGTLDPATVTYGTKVDGTDNLDVVVVPCPFEGCGAVSFWPPGGGADALLGQSLHVAVALNAQPVARGAQRDTTSVVAEVKARVVAMDGEERWVLDEATLEVLTHAG